jgi:hypothetical protein
VRAELGQACVSLFDDRWDDLVRRQAVPNPTLSSTWLRHLVESEEGTPLAVTVERADALVAAGAFGLYRPAGRFGPVLARWLGDYREWFSPDLLVDPAAGEAGELVVDAVLRHAHAIHVPASETGAAAAALTRRVPWSVTARDADGWVVELPPPRSARLVRTFRIDCHRAARHGADVTSRVATSPVEILDALERLFALHAARWRARGGQIPGFSTTEGDRARYRRVTAAMAERGDALTVEILENGEVVASALGFLAGRGAMMHTTSFRSGALLRMPGHAALLVLLRAFEEAGVQVIDLGWSPEEPGSPKARTGPTHIVFKRFLAARSRALQQVVSTALAARAAIRTRRRRSP